MAQEDVTLLEAPLGGDGPFDRLLAHVAELDPERTNLLHMGALRQIESVLQAASDFSQDGAVMTALTYARNTLEFLSQVLSAEHNAHEDWTRTGDAKVNAVWQEWVEVLQNLQLSANDLEPEVAARIANDEATEEDWALVKRLMSEKTGVPAEELREEMFGFTKTEDKAEDGYVPPAVETKYL